MRCRTCSLVAILMWPVCFVCSAAGPTDPGPKEGPVTVRQRSAQDRHEFIIENDFIRVALAPSHGGAVTEMRYKKNAIHPGLADKGDGVAGTGLYFVPMVHADGRKEPVARLDPNATTEILERGPDRVKVKITTTVPELEGLTLVRLVQAGRGESGFTLTDAFTPRAGSPVRLRIGGAADQRSETWRTDLRLLLGERGAPRFYVGPRDQGEAKTWTSAGRDAQFQTISQYGLGILAAITAPAGPVDYQVRLPRQPGVPGHARWLSAAVELAAGKSAVLETAVLVCTGMHEAKTISPQRWAATAYCPRVADPGDTLPFWAVAVAPTRQTVRVELEIRRDNEGTPQRVGSREVTLEPGQGREIRFDGSIAKKGLFDVVCNVRQNDALLAHGGCRLWVDDGPGDADSELGRMRQRHLRRFPERHYRGSWFQIGRQLAREKAFSPGKVDERSARRLRQYREMFPYYHELLQGAAAELNVPLEQMARARTSEGPGRAGDGSTGHADTACMTFYLNGPDGPICAYTKERRSFDAMSGLSYLKVLPDRGYKFHMYPMGWTAGYGINEKGLCTGGASINCDDRTARAGDQMTARWRAQGNLTAPLGPLMLLASCATVDEAVRFIENKRAPLDFRGNMLIVDRRGDAAILQSMGIKHMVRRYRGPRDRLDPNVPAFCATNYTHPNAAGEFTAPGPNWGDYANGLVREWRLQQFIRQLDGRPRLSDAFWILQSQNQPGGFCLNGFDNVARLYANTAYVGHPKTGDLYMTCGHSLEVHFHHYRLND